MLTIAEILQKIELYLKKELSITDVRSLNYVIIGLIFFYSSQFFIHGKLLYFLSYFILIFFFYYALKKINLVILLTLVVSLFFEVGLANRWFILQPTQLNMGSGWWISPKTFLFLSLLLLTFKNRKLLNHFKIKSSDVMLALFFFWAIFSFFFQTNINFFIGIFQLFEMVIIYYLLRLHLSDQNLGMVIFILFSQVIFQSFISFGQLIYKRPLGLIIESTLVKDPFLLTTVEGTNIFRLTGTFGHPNMLAAFMISLAPFVILFRPASFIYGLIDLLIFLIIFYTYSRISWFFFIIEYLFCLNLNKLKKFPAGLNLKRLLMPVIILLIVLIFLIYPNLLGRWQSTGFSIQEYGSLGMRIKMMQEGLNLVAKQPLLGVGLNRSLEYYAKNPVTDLFQNTKPDPFYRIHNTFLEIASELGIIGLILFLLFIYFVLISAIKEKRNSLIKSASTLGMAGLIIIAYVNPFFHTIQMDIMFLLAAVVLV